MMMTRDIMRIQLDKSTVFAGSQVSGVVIDNKPKNFTKVKLLGMERLFVKTDDGEDPGVAEVCIFMELETTVDANGRFTFDLAKDLPMTTNLKIQRIGSPNLKTYQPGCGIVYKIFANQTSVHVVVLQRPSMTVVDSLSIRIGQAVPILKSSLCGLIQTPYTTYPLLIQDHLQLPLQPGVKLQTVLDDPEGKLSPYPLRGRLSEIVAYSARGNSIEYRFMHELRGNDLKIPSLLRPTMKTEHISIRHELILFVCCSNDQFDDETVIATTNPIPVTVVIHELSSYAPEISVHPGTVHLGPSVRAAEKVICSQLGPVLRVAYA